MACTGITDIVTRETGRIYRDIYERNYAQDPWNHLTQRGHWPEGMGEVISVLTYERTAPVVANPVWANITVVNAAEGGACLPAATLVSVGSSALNFNLQRSVLEGPDFCAEEMRSVFELNQQLDSIINALAGYTKIQWMMRHKHEYFRLVRRKVAVTSTGLTETNTAAATFPAVDANAFLTQGVLDKYKVKLIRDGAGQSALGQLDGGPVLTLIIGAEASDSLLRAAAEARDDLRWGKPSELLRQIGVERSYRGFFHVIDPYPMRYSFSAGVYTEVPPFLSSAVTKGNKVDVNPSWEDPAIATHEAAFIFDPTVYRALIPAPVVAPHPQFKFDPVNYMGNWGIRNIPDRICNPDGTILYHRGILASGSMPVHPERGVAFIYKRCDPPMGLTATCPTAV